MKQALLLGGEVPAKALVGQMTPQLAVQQAMAAMSAKAQEMTGIALPKYYNPAAVNPLKYAEQMQKRKLLWNANKEKPEVSRLYSKWIINFVFQFTDLEIEKFSLGEFGVDNRTIYLSLN